MRLQCVFFDLEIRKQYVVMDIDCTKPSSSFFLRADSLATDVCSCDDGTSYTESELLGSQFRDAAAAAAIVRISHFRMSHGCHSLVYSATAPVGTHL